MDDMCDIDDMDVGEGGSAGAQLLDLPDELLLHILRFASAKELRALSAVCRGTRELANSDYVWAHLLQRDFGLGGAAAACSCPRRLYASINLALREADAAGRHARATIDFDPKALDYERTRSPFLRVAGLWADGGCDGGELHRYSPFHVFEASGDSYCSEASHNVHIAGEFDDDPAQRGLDDGSPELSFREFALTRMRHIFPIFDGAISAAISTDQILQIWSDVWGSNLRASLLQGPERDEGSSAHVALLQRADRLTRAYRAFRHARRDRVECRRMDPSSPLLLACSRTFAHRAAVAASGPPTVALLRSIVLRRPPAFTCPVRTGVIFLSCTPLSVEPAGRGPAPRPAWPAVSAFDGVVDAAAVSARRGARGAALPPPRRTGSSGSCAWVEFERPAEPPAGPFPVVWFQFRDHGPGVRLLEEGAEEVDAATVPLEQVFCGRHVLVKLIDAEDRMAAMGDDGPSTNLDLNACLFRGAALRLYPDGSFACA
eukprot:tig00021680_g23044.t1